MVNLTSGYMNSVSSLRRYNYNNMRSVSSDYNNAGVKERNNRQSYINNDAVRYVAKIQVNAQSMRDSIGNVTKADTFSRMRSAQNNSANAVRDDANKAVNRRESEPETVRMKDAQTAAAQPNGAQNRSEGISGGTRAARDKAVDKEQSVPVAANEKEVKTTARTDRSEATKVKADTGAVRNMANSFNKLFETAGSGFGNNRLVRDLRDTVEAYAAPLRRIGVEVNKDGALSINEEKLANAERTGAIKASFSAGGENSGFANRLVRIAENVTGNRQVSGRSGVNEEESRRNAKLNNTTEAYRQSTNKYDYVYGYSAPGTLFNLYA